MYHTYELGIIPSNMKKINILIFLTELIDFTGHFGQGWFSDSLFYL